MEPIKNYDEAFLIQHAVAIIFRVMADDETWESVNPT
jgi:hypothetical protein